MMTIVKFNDFQDLTVKFEGKGNLVKAQYSSFKSGYIKNPYDPTVYSHGYIGEGIYKTGKTGNLNRNYATWKGMLQRCYDPKFQQRQPEYKGCTVSKEWLNFQVFAEWYNNNYYEIEGQTMSLDKDILVKGNKIYSPQTAIFVPRDINNLFISHKPQRGNLPIGVQKDNTNNNYIARCSEGSGNKNRGYIGHFDTPEEAFYAYRDYKEEYIKEIAEQYKKLIPKKLYKAMINYIVGITD